MEPVRSPGPMGKWEGMVGAVPMRSLTQLAENAGAGALSEADIDWLHLLLSDWQVLADLAAADLVLWLPTSDGRFIAGAHCRPATSSTVHVDDIVGLYLPAARTAELREAMDTCEVVRPAAARWAGSYSMMEICVPVVREGRCLAVLTRESNLSSPRVNPGFEGWTIRAADTLSQMITRGEYPYDSTPTATAGHGVPRVMDGAILLDPDGRVQEASPNAVSCLRRLGVRHPIWGRVLAEDITDVVQGDESMVDETLAVVVMGRASWRVEVEAHNSTVSMRALPLREGKKRLGAVLLTRDVTETRQREQELMTKDATIREIHHRVKNNLQTVSALLRLQARRSASPEVKAALGQAERRVETIATVHEALSQTVDEVVNFDDVAHSVLRMAGAVASTDQPVEVAIQGSFGPLPAKAAAALATVLNELVTNSVEHGFHHRSGLVRVEARRRGTALTVRVIDNGSGIPRGAALSGLGTQIVRTVVHGELHGRIAWDRGEEQGTVVTLHMNLADL